MAYLAREERREQIMSAVVDLVMAEGLQAATVRRIAQRLECSPGQIHHHFASADALRAAAVIEVWRRIEPAYKAIIAPLPPRARLVALLSDEHPDLSSELDEYVAISTRLWNEAWDTRTAPEVRSVIHAAARDIRAAVAEALTEGMASGVFPPLDAERLSLLLLAASQGYDVMAEIFDRREMARSKAAYIDEILTLHGLPAGSAPP